VADAVEAKVAAEPVLFVGLTQERAPAHAQPRKKREILPETPYRASDQALDQLITGDLTPEQRKQFNALVHEFADIFAENEDALGRTDLAKHQIRLSDTQPIKQRPYRHGYAQDKFIRAELARMQRLGIIRESESPYAMPVVIVTKKGGKLRFCVEYRRLNWITIKDSYPLPRIDDLLENLAGSKYFSSIDLLSGYWQVAMDEKDIEKTAFVTKYGLFEFTVMPFGLTNAPPTFQRLMDKVFRDLKNTCVAVYMDDVNIHSPTWEQHLLDLRQAFLRIRAANLRLNIPKCHFAKPKVVFLGFVVTKEGVHTDPAKVEHMVNLKIPKDVHELRSLLGTFSFYRRFIPNFAKEAQPLNWLLKKNRLYTWTQRQQLAFDTLRMHLIQAPILIAPDPEQRFQLYTDASYKGFGALLGQKDAEGKDHVVAYASRACNKHEERYAPVALECCAAHWAVQYFRQYLWGTEFDLYTDQAALNSLFQKGDLNNRTLGRWLNNLQEYDFKTHYRPGKLNRADILSRAL